MIVLGFIKRKINIDPPMCLSQRKDSPGTGMGQYKKVPARVRLRWGMSVGISESSAGF